MQSIWYGRQEKLFGDKEERQELIAYTRKVCLFAKAIGCKNLVFGNPRNRDTDDVASIYSSAIEFFHTIGEIALEYDTVIAIEPNPTIYNTHFLNYTEQAVEMAYKANSDGVKVNFDLGTVIQNEEDVQYINDVAEFINHVHISEPYLDIINKEHEPLHRAIIAFGKAHPEVFISIEMGNKGDVDQVKNTMSYVKQIYETLQ